MFHCHFLFFFFFFFNDTATTEIYTLSLHDALPICLWFDQNAEEAARFYAATFPDTRIDAIHRSPGDYPSGKKRSEEHTSELQSRRDLVCRLLLEKKKKKKQNSKHKYKLKLTVIKST